MIKSLALAALAAALAWPTYAQDLDSMSVEELLPIAKAEGEVVVYSFTSRIAEVEQAFEGAYPDIDLQGYDISSTKQIARLQAEAKAGIANADVVYAADVPVLIPELLETGIIVPYVPPRVADRIPQAFQEPLLVHRLSTKVLMYNEAAYPDGPPVDSLWDLTRPEWEGKVIIVDPLQRGDYLDLMTEIVLRADEMAAAYEAEFGQPIKLGDTANAGEKFIMDLFANGLILVSSTDAVNAAVGEIDQKNPPLGFTSYSDRRDNEAQGWALQVANGVAPAPGIIYPAIIAPTASAPHPAAARLLMDFMMGDESKTGGPALAPFYVPGDYLTRIDIPPQPDAIPLDEFNAWRIDPQETATVRDQIGDLILMLQ